MVYRFSTYRCCNGLCSLLEWNDGTHFAHLHTTCFIGLLLVMLSRLTTVYMLLIITPPRLELIGRYCNTGGGAKVVFSNNAIWMGLDAPPPLQDKGTDDGTEEPRIVQLKQGAGLEYWHEGGLNIGTFMSLNSLAPSLHVMPAEGRKGENTTVVIDVGQIVGAWEDQGPMNATAWMNLMDSVQNTLHEIDPLKLNLDGLWKAAAKVNKRKRSYSNIAVYYPLLYTPPDFIANNVLAGEMLIMGDA